MLQQILLLIAANAISAITYPVCKLSFACGQPLFLTGIRMFLGGVILFWYALLSDKKPFARSMLNKHFLFLLLLLSFFNIFFTNFLQFWALNYLSASKAIFIFNLSPFISAVLSYYLYNEVMTFKKGLALTIAFIGFLPIILTSEPNHGLTGMSALLPEAALLLAAVISVVGWLLMKKIVQSYPISVSMANGLSMIIGSTAFFPVSRAMEGPEWSVITNHYFLGFLIFVLIIANNIIAYNCYAYFLKRLSATLLFLISFTNPLFAHVYGWLFLDEPIGIYFGLTVIIVTFGLWLYYHEEERIILQKKSNHTPA